MQRSGRRTAAVLACGALLVLSGCNGGPTGPTTVSETREPFDVPNAVDRTPTREPTPRVSTATPANGQRRYAELDPTCRRPPGLVIEIQLGALRYNDPTTNDGIHAVWRFASPRNRESLGRFDTLVSILQTERYAPLLAYEAVAYGPLEINRTTAVARQRVTVIDPDGSTATYRWELSRQTDGRYDGCWMTDVVARLSPDRAVIAVDDDGTVLDAGVPTPDGNGTTPVERSQP